MTRMARSPAARSRPAIASTSGAESRPRLPVASSARRSTISTDAVRARGAGPRAGRARSVALLGAAEGHEVRRRRPEDDRHGREAAELERDVARLVARRAVGLVGGVVLLVDDDEAEARAAG